MSARTAAVLGTLLVLAACARPGAGDTGSAEGRPYPYAADDLVAQAGWSGGFVSPQVVVGRLPIVSVYGDGRVLADGPVPAIYPGPALPNVLVGHLDQDEVQQLVTRMLDAGVGDTADLGTPPVADAPSTRFTVSTGLETVEREVYALREAPDDGGGALSADQVAARAELSDLLDELTELSVDADEPYVPESLAVLAGPYTPDDEPQLSQPDVTWPGPALPGEALPGPLGLSCVVATGDQATAVLEAAAQANARTPWVTADGGRWSLTFRPLLPDETGCADLTGA